MRQISGLIANQGQELTFDHFYDAYPKKANKKKAEALWNKLADAKKHLAIVDISARKERHHQWKDKNFVPAPDVYLRNEKWTDDIIEQRTKDAELAETEDGSPQARFWNLLKQTYGDKFKRAYGDTMPWVWRRSLDGITPEEIAYILSYLTNDKDIGMPDLPKINRIRAIGKRSWETFQKKLPGKEVTPDERAAIIAKHSEDLNKALRGQYVEPVKQRK